MNGQRSERSECFGRMYETHSRSCARSTSAEHVTADALASRRHMNEPLASVLAALFASVSFVADSEDRDRCRWCVARDFACGMRLN